MIRTTLRALALLLLGHASQLVAQAADSPDGKPPSRAVGVRLSYSVDADDTRVVARGVVYDFDHRGPDRYRGVELEKVSFNPQGQGWRNRERVYLRAADRQGNLTWNARLGTDGDTVLGAASLRKETKLPYELFIERDIVETRRGLDTGIYYTFAGAGIDLPLSRSNTISLLAGVQEFTGDNVRLHLRGNYIHVLSESIGLSAQLRGRYFSNSDPREADYFSPRWYAQVLPVLQLRRFSGGWQYLVAGGIGVQREADSDWRRSSFLNARVTSPAAGDWYVTSTVLFSETPTIAGPGYNYFQASLALNRRF